MKFFYTASFFALATAVAAAPGYGPAAGSPPAVSNQQINANQCGNQNLKCCNKEINKVNAKGVDSDFGVLNGLIKNFKIEDVSIFDQCSKINVPVGVLGAGVADLVNQQCKQTAACCQQTSSEANGVVALAVPCIPVNVL